jgi:hypothetical protein
MCLYAQFSNHVGVSDLEQLTSEHPCLKGHLEVFQTNDLQKLYLAATSYAEQAVVMDLMASQANQNRFEKLADLRKAHQVLGRVIDDFNRDTQVVQDILSKDIEVLERLVQPRKKILAGLPEEVQTLNDILKSGGDFVNQCQFVVTPLDIKRDHYSKIQKAWGLTPEMDLKDLSIESVRGYLDKLHEEGFGENPCFRENVSFYEKAGTIKNPSVGMQVLRGRDWNDDTARGLLALYLRLLPISPEFEPSRKSTKQKKASPASNTATSKPPAVVNAFHSNPPPKEGFPTSHFYFGTSMVGTSATVGNSNAAFSFGTKTDSDSVSASTTATAAGTSTTVSSKRNSAGEEIVKPSAKRARFG